LALLRDGHIAGAGLDVLPVEPPVDPIPEILRAYRDREPGLEGRLVITPHAAWFTSESEHDTRVKSAETMRGAADQPPAERDHARDVLAPAGVISSAPTN
jgi:phosphoglycerate dehydrogenase-like enzyme